MQYFESTKKQWSKKISKPSTIYGIFRILMTCLDNSPFRLVTKINMISSPSLIYFTVIVQEYFFSPVVSVKVVFPAFNAFS